MNADDLAGRAIRRAFDAAKTSWQPSPEYVERVVAGLGHQANPRRDGLARAGGIGAVVAAVILAGAGPWFPGSGNPSSEGSGATGTSRPSLATLADPSAETPGRSRHQPYLELSAGRYPMRVPTKDGGDIAFTLELPTGWMEIHGGMTLAGPDATDNGRFAKGLLVAMLAPDALFSDPCHWDGLGDGMYPGVPDVAVGPTASDLADALRANSAYDTTRPTAVNLDGYSGLRMRLSIPEHLDLDTCDQVTHPREAAYFVFGSTGQMDGNITGLPGEIDELFIVDVNGKRLVAVIRGDEYTLGTQWDAAVRVIRSIQFDR